MQSQINVSATSRLSSLYRSYELIFWLVVLVGIVFIVSSFPMMKLRFDIWDHVDRIRSMVLDSTAPSPAKRYWYACWAFVFRLFNVTDLFTIATVVHRVQFIANCLLIYFAAKQLFAPLLSLNRRVSSQNQWLSSLALSSVMVWLTIIGTYSFFQQAWIMWYSVNYQITLSMLFLALALTVNILATPQALGKVTFKACLVLVLLACVLMFHAGELAYLLFYIPILCLCFWPNYKINIKYILISVILVFIILYFGIKFYEDQIPALFTHLKNGEYQKLLTDIYKKGTWNAVHGGNRYSANWNELYALSVYLLIGIGIAVYMSWLKITTINKKVLCFLLLSLVFCFMPTFVYTAGLLSLISYDGIVNRYYYASFVYLALPLAAYIFLKYWHTSPKPAWLLLFVGLLMLSTFGYSKIINNEGVYYQNVQSIMTSMQSKRINIDVHEDEIESIRLQLLAAEAKYPVNTYIYCGAYESLHITAYIFNKKSNLIFDRLGNHALEDCFQNAKKNSKTIVYLN